LHRAQEPSRAICRVGPFWSPWTWYGHRSPLALLFVTEVWQIYILMLLLQSASAAFTPTFQATIPDMLPEERDYTRALAVAPRL
jgi:hypothetical protein